MANSLTTNPWILDTPGAAILYKYEIASAHFEWANYVGQADQVVVKDAFGKNIWTASGRADGSLVQSFSIEWIHGLALNTLTSGVVRMYFE